LFVGDIIAVKHHEGREIDLQALIEERALQPDFVVVEFSGFTVVALQRADLRPVWAASATAHGIGDIAITSGVNL